jgi:hypothetical protein
LDERGDLVAKELGGGLVGLLVDQQIGEREAEAETAALPARLVFALALLSANRQGRRFGHRHYKADP